MNRLILIGNGFDLTHGLKTSYADFIEWYWEEWGKRLRSSTDKLVEDHFCSFQLNNGVLAAGWYLVWPYYFKTNPLRPLTNKEIVDIAKQHGNLCSFISKNKFFEDICEHLQTKKWVDIEDVFYDFLKKSLVPKLINDDLEFIKEKLIEYLNTLTEPTLNSIIQNQIFAPISKEDIAIGSMDKWKEMMLNRLEYSKNDWEDLLAGYYTNIGEFRAVESTIEHFKHEIENGVRSNDFDDEYIEKICPAYKLPDKIMLLNFNYTNTADLYLPDVYRFSVNHIHGSLSNPESVILGYGDERDDEYQPLMKKNDNEYLRHIKSFHYLESSNYRKMREFIESGPYQVCIMGHSCGISDRTLLKTLFEHKYCVSIKPYYYRDKDGKDNYFDLICNIARNISDPSLMRDRVVRKEHCQPLGQLS